MLLCSTYCDHRSKSLNRVIKPLGTSRHFKVGSFQLIQITDTGIEGIREQFAIIISFAYSFEIDGKIMCILLYLVRVSV